MSETLKRLDSSFTRRRPPGNDVSRETPPFLYCFSRGASWVSASGGAQDAVEAALALITARHADDGILTVHAVAGSEHGIVVVYSLGGPDEVSTCAP